MEIVIFGPEGMGMARANVGAPSFLDELEQFSKEEGQTLKLISHEIPSDWFNLQNNGVAEVVKNLENDIRERAVKTIILTLSKNQRSFKDWPKFLRQVCERVKSKEETFVTSHLVVALMAPNKSVFEKRRKEHVEIKLQSFLTDTKQKEDYDWRNTVLWLHKDRLHLFLEELVSKIKTHNFPITTVRNMNFRVFNQCHLFDCNELVVSATCLNDLREQMLAKSFNLQFYTQRGRSENQAGLAGTSPKQVTDSTFGQLPQNSELPENQNTIELTVKVKCPRCEREVTREESHLDCDLYQAAIEDKDKMLEFLKSFELESIFSTLKKEDISLDILLDIQSEEELKKMGVAKIGQRKKLLNAIDRFNIGEKKNASIDVGKGQIEEGEAYLPRQEVGGQISFSPNRTEPTIEVEPSLDEPQPEGEGNSPPRPEDGGQILLQPRRTEPTIERNLVEPQPEGEGNSLLPESECSATKKSNLFVC